MPTLVYEAPKSVHRPAADVDDDERACAALVAEAKRRVGTTLRGKWRLERILGVGGMGAVYEARHRNGMRGAVKVLDSSLAREQDCRERFLREGRIANEVDHVGAVRVLDDDETDDGSAFLVMELLDGVTLEQLAMMRGGTLAPEETVRYAAQVLDTLAAAHARGIVHRDIKPENLFLTEHGVVKILDFGIARMRDGLGDDTRVTRAGEPLGTPAFMSPEQARGHLEAIDERTDLYSVGATMFNLVTGEPVHADATTVAELIATVITRPARSVKAAADVPEALAAVIDRALSFDKNARYASAEEMRAALEQAYRAMTGDPIPATPTPPPVSLPPPTPPMRSVFSRPVKRAAAVLVPSIVAAACFVVVGTNAAEPDRRAKDLAPARAMAQIETPPLAPPIPPVARAATPPLAQPVVRPRFVAPVVRELPAQKDASRASSEDASASPRQRVANISRYSRWSALYERRH